MSASFEQNRSALEWAQRWISETEKKPAHWIESIRADIMHGMPKAHALTALGMFADLAQREQAQRLSIEIGRDLGRDSCDQVEPLANAGQAELMARETALRKRQDMLQAVLDRLQPMLLRVNKTG